MAGSKNIAAVDTHYSDILDVLDNIVDDRCFDATSRAEAQGHADKLQNVYNFFLLKLFRLLFGYADILTTYLQSSNVDPALVAQKVADYQQRLECVRTEASFKDIWATVSAADLPEPVRKRKANIRHLSDSGYHVSAQDDSDVTIETQCRNLMFEVIDCLKQQLLNRFDDIAKFAWIRLLHVDNFGAYQNDSPEVRRLVSAFSSFYAGVISDVDKVCIELKCLYTDSQVAALLVQRKVKDCAGLLKIVVDCKLQDALPSVWAMLHIAVTIPLTSVVCERTFSVLKRVKTFSRSTMLQTRLKHLMALAVEKDIVLSLSRQPDFYDRVIDVFAAMKERRIKLIYKV